jgi:hypothetical protein
MGFNQSNADAGGYLLTVGPPHECLKHGMNAVGSVVWPCLPSVRHLYAN